MGELCTALDEKLERLLLACTKLNYCEDNF